MVRVRDRTPRSDRSGSVPESDARPRWRWVVFVVVPMLLVVAGAEAAMRAAERRFDAYDIDLDRGDEPVLKLRGAVERLDEGGLLFTGASDAESAFFPGVVADAAGANVAETERSGFNASVAGMAPTLFSEWVDDLLDAGASPQAVVVGVSPAQFLELPLDLERPEDGFTVRAALDSIERNISRAPQYAGIPGGVGNDVALIRSRHRLHHPTDAWNALRGGPPPALSGADRTLRPDGTNARWDEPIGPDWSPPPQAPADLLGPPRLDFIDEFADGLADLEAEGRAVAVVLLPVTPELEVVRSLDRFDDARAEATDALCRVGVAVLDLTGEVFSRTEFANSEHFSAAGAARISTAVGEWTADGGLRSCDP